MLISGIAAVLVIVVIIFLLVPSQPKGELLFTQQLIPSDTDQVIRAKSDLEIVVPSGEIDKPCSIEVRTAPGLPAPDNNAQLINAYNISIDGKKEFESYLDIRMALTDGRPSDFTCLYYNPHNKSWEGIPYSIDASRRQTVISTRHLSIFSLVKQDPSIVPGPMMKLGHTRFPSGRMMSYSNMLRMLQSYRTNSQVDEKEAYVAGWSAFTEWYGLTGTGMGFVENALEIDALTDINGMIGNLGTGFAFAQAVIDMSSGDTANAVFGVMKELSNYSITNLIFETKAMNIAMVGVFAIDYSLNKFAQTAVSSRYEIYDKAYRLYYSEKQRNEGINSVWWYKKLKKAALKARNMEEAKKILDEIFLGYFDEFWNNEEIVALYQDKVSGQGFTGGGGLSEEVKNKISEAYMGEIRQSIDWVFVRIIKEMRLEFLEKLHNQLEKLRKSMNQEYFVDIKVKLESETSDRFPDLSFEGLPVSFDVNSPAHKGKWNARLNRKGEAVIPFTLLGYLHAGSPTMASIRIPDPERPGDSLSFAGEFKLSQRNANKVEILIGIPDKDGIKGSWEVEGILERIEVSNVYSHIGCPRPSEDQVNAAVNSYRQMVGTKPVKLDNLEIQGLLSSFDIRTEGNFYVVTYSSLGGASSPSHYRVQLKGKSQFEGVCTIPVYLNQYCGIECKASFKIKGKKLRNYQLF